MGGVPRWRSYYRRSFPPYNCSCPDSEGVPVRNPRLLGFQFSGNRHRPDQAAFVRHRGGLDSQVSVLDARTSDPRFGDLLLPVLFRRGIDNPANFVDIDPRAPFTSVIDPKSGSCRRENRRSRWCRNSLRYQRVVTRRVVTRNFELRSSWNLCPDTIREAK